MSIKVLGDVTHNSVDYFYGDIVTDITREEAERLIDLDIAIKIDDKFKIPKEVIRKNMAMVRDKKRRYQMIWYSKNK